VSAKQVFNDCDIILKIRTPEVNTRLDDVHEADALKTSKCKLFIAQIHKNDNKEAYDKLLNTGNKDLTVYALE
jgi:hypothetical protein